MDSFWQKYFSTTDLEKIEHSVQSAEKKTSGEIVPIVVKKSSTTGHTPIILILLCFLLYLVLDGPTHVLELPVYFRGLEYVTFIFLMVLAFYLARIPELQRRYISSADKTSQCETRAQLEFYKHGLNNTEGSTGILIFISLLERRVVILADKAIDERMPEGTWDELVKQLTTQISKKKLTEGLIEAIHSCGEILAPHFPIKSDDQNELKNHLILKD